MDEKSVFNIPLKVIFIYLSQIQVLELSTLEKTILQMPELKKIIFEVGMFPWNFFFAEK